MLDKCRLSSRVQGCNRFRLPVLVVLSNSSYGSIVCPFGLWRCCFGSQGSVKCFCRVRLSSHSDTCRRSRCLILCCCSCNPNLCCSSHQHSGPNRSARDLRVPTSCQRRTCRPWREWESREQCRKEPDRSWNNTVDRTVCP